MKGLAGRADPRFGTMRSNIDHSAWPPVSDDRHAVLAAAAMQFDMTQWRPAAEIAAHQKRQLVELADFHRRHTPAFAARLDAAGLVPADLADDHAFVRLAELGRQEVQDWDTTRAPEGVPKKHCPVTKVNTSGSTGEPVRVPRTALNRLHWLALSVRYHLWDEPDAFGRFASIRANMPSYGIKADWGAPISTLWPTAPLLLIDIESDIDDQIDHLSAFAADSVMIYPSNLAALCDRLDAEGRSLPGVKRWRTLGETLTEDLRDRFQADEVPVSDCYSSEELGYLALQCPDNPELYHICAETVLIELVDAEGRPVKEGEIGRVLVTDLHNLAAPMIRYAIGDHAIAGPACPCGRGLPTLRRIAGRTRNMIVKPDGTRHWPLTGYKQFRDIAPVRQYQFRQTAIDRIEVWLVTDRPLTTEEEAALRAHLHWKLRHPFTIDFAYFDGRLPTGKNGKFEEFLSLL